MLKMMIKMAVTTMRLDIQTTNGRSLWWLVPFISSVDKFGLEYEVEFTPLSSIALAVSTIKDESDVFHLSKSGIFYVLVVINLY